jgi:hypothetical protein
LNVETSTAFDVRTLSTELGEDGTGITVPTGEVLDQAMLQGLLAKIRTLAPPAPAVNCVDMLTY